MSYRRQMAKPSLALWMLVAIGDVLLILAHAGLLALIALAGVLALAGATWLLIRRAVTTNETVPVAPRAARHRVTP
ncbi:MAG TPA: hypothetical protein VF462_13230 [Micromonosporaceae bacterium]